MTQPTTVLTFKKNGERQVETFGVSGPICKKMSKYLEDALGVAGDELKKAEWYAQNSEQLRNQKKMGIDGSKLCG